MEIQGAHYTVLLRKLRKIQTHVPCTYIQAWSPTDSLCQISLRCISLSCCLPCLQPLFPRPPNGHSDATSSRTLTHPTVLLSNPHLCPPRPLVCIFTALSPYGVQNHVFGDLPLTSNWEQGFVTLKCLVHVCYSQGSQDVLLACHDSSYQASCSWVCLSHLVGVG